MRLFRRALRLPIVDAALAGGAVGLIDKSADSEHGAVLGQADASCGSRRTGGPWSLVVIDDHPTFVALVSLALAAQPDFRILGTATNATTGIALIADTRPDLVLIDIRLPDLDGIAATRRIRHLFPDATVIVCSAYTDTDWVTAAVAAGAAGHAFKTGSLQHLLDALRVAAASRPAA